MFFPAIWPKTLPSADLGLAGTLEAEGVQLVVRAPARPPDLVVVLPVAQAASVWRISGVARAGGEPFWANAREAIKTITQPNTLLILVIDLFSLLEAGCLYDELAASPSWVPKFMWKWGQRCLPPGSARSSDA